MGYEVQLAHDFYFIWKWTINLPVPKEQLSPSAFQLCLQHADKRQCMWSAGSSPCLFLPAHGHAFADFPFIVAHLQTG